MENYEEFEIWVKIIVRNYRIYSKQFETNSIYSNKEF